MLKTKQKARSTSIGVSGDLNYFMPKVQKLRPDGASLTMVYESKQQDLWGKIIKGQYIADEENKIVKRKQKEDANDEYARCVNIHMQSHDCAFYLVMFIYFIVFYCV